MQVVANSILLNDALMALVDIYHLTIWLQGSRVSANPLCHHNTNDPLSFSLCGGLIKQGISILQ